VKVVPVMSVLACLLGVASAEQGARYLVIVQDGLEGSIAPLAEWRHASGLQTKVVLMSETGSDTSAIHDYVQDAYDNWPIRPEFVLLVGHPANLKACRYGPRMDRYYSDNYYGDMAGDYRAELMVGRFPVRSTAQCDLMVEKTLAYETEPPLEDSVWMRRLTTVIREDYDSDDTIYWNNARHAASLAGAAGFVSCDSLSRQRGHGLSDLVGSVDEGTGLVVYRGTAGGNWREPFEINPDVTDNGGELPVIISTTCETMALDPYDSMVGSAWVKAGWNGSPHGAVAFFGNTHSAANVARQRGAVCRGFFTGLFAEDRYVLGDAALRAKAQLYAEFPQDESDYRGFGLFGDPGLKIWTATPQELVVAHAGEILPEQQQFEVTVSCNEALLAGALVCASMDTTVYASDTTDSVGTVYLDISPTDTGYMRLVVTARNCLPYDTLVLVTDQVGLAGPGLEPVSGQYRISAEPNVFTGGTRIAFNAPARVGARIELLNIAGCAIRSFPAAGRDRIAWDGKFDAGRNSGPGVYFCELLDSDGRLLDRTKLIKLD
jgi:hypothetical protein